MDIRFASIKDIPDLINIFHELETYYFAQKAAPREEIEKYLKFQVFAEHSGIKMVIAKHNGEVIGFSTFCILYPAPRLSGQAFMKDLFSSQSVRGKGTGKAIMKFIANYAISKGCKRLDWTTEKDNPKAGSFYRHIGAREVHEKQYFRFENDDLINFAKSPQ
ncbi:MAG: N-acetyltransferase family protein [Candidatus Hodarchaeales archaeon]|jgi:GNAT superfamily N-acetyltransferase